MNQLWFGDNLTILREEVAADSVDLIYLDPPFNSNANYNVLFRTPSDAAASAQVEAFRDTWTWGNEAQWALDEIMMSGGPVANIIHALHSALGESDMMAYLVMMAQRLHELKRVLRSSGSLFLHCDATASHYLKIILDAVFGPQLFANEIIWQRSTGKSLMSKRLPNNHDVILSYSKGRDRTWNAEALYEPYDPENLPAKIAAKYTGDDGDGRLYQLADLLNPNPDRPNLDYEFLGVRRVWRWTRDRMEAAHQAGRIFQSAPGKVPRYKRYLDEMRGMPLGDVWTDIPPLNSQAKERLGYPTQKPVKLLDRILQASTMPGDTVLDPFCGCGTTIAAAEGIGRNWVGIDVAFHAIKVIEDRIRGQNPSVAYEVGGIPRDFESAQRLALKDKFQFQWWANYLVGVQALKEIKKGPDRGIDGQMFFMNGPRGWGRILTSVKGGQHVGTKDVREFKAVLDRERAEMGLFICLNEATRDMNTEAAAFGFVQTAHGHLPRLQIVSMAEWFRGKRPHLPSLGHVSRDFFNPEKRANQKRAKALNPDAPEFTFTFAGGKKEDTVVHFNPSVVNSDRAEVTP
ncbi:site-specific DNA-methyltransferase [Rhizobium leguminosarum]|uniref:site-specific DNA-methyltransferase (adenine-specific) n=1 Tax=Rhizobium leguminosarum TaxID=384 RepID=A0A4Q8XY17_RHILE|nr:site-specific DNA-methyltransferase [Rhizobium leguminosarum]TAX71829.1 site-specific DNA-methyltransferase [Rhizobium leguminosarum]